jgi:serine/threonine protein kinase
MRACDSAQGGFSFGKKKKEVSLSEVKPTSEFFDYQFHEGLCKGKLIGGGNFGCVYRGRFVQTKTKVALKEVHGTSNMAEFINECLILQELRHPHIVSFFGLWKDSSEDAAKTYIVMELLQGSLLNLLRGDPSMSVSTLTAMARDVSSGMAFLSDNNLVHRDLAARNVLYLAAGDCKYLCKVGDFGMTRVVDHDTGVYSCGPCPIPAKWTAPESLQAKRGQFSWTTKSDVWSFGVFLFELYSHANTPYSMIAIEELPAFLRGGHRLPVPAQTPEVIKELMLKCWQQEPEDRPTWKKVCHLIRKQKRAHSKKERDEKEENEANQEETPSTCDSPTYITRNPLKRQLANGNIYYS